VNEDLPLEKASQNKNQRKEQRNNSTTFTISQTNFIHSTCCLCTKERTPIYSNHGNPKSHVFKKKY